MPTHSPAGTALPHRYTASVPVFRRYARQLGTLLDVAEAAGDAGVLHARLVPDMMPFHLQVDVAANFMLRAAFPLAGRPVPHLGEPATNFPALRARLHRAVALLDGLDPQAFVHDGLLADRAGHADLQLPPDEFLFQYALPNFFFHVTSAYHVLRLRGLPVGKADFDGYHVYPR